MSLCSRQHTRTALTSSPHLLPHKQRSTRHLQPWANVPSVVPRSISKRRRQAAESQIVSQKLPMDGWYKSLEIRNEQVCAVVTEHTL